MTSIQGGVYFLAKPADINDSWIKVRAGDTATTVRRYQWNTEPLSLVVSHGNKSHMLLTIISCYIFTHVCVCHGYDSRAAFIWLRASEYVATIRGWRLFEKIQYSDCSA